MLDSYDGNKNPQKEKDIIFNALKSPPEQIVELDLVAQAITELQKTKQALQESEGRYKSIFTNVPLGIIHFDPIGKILDCNDNFLNTCDAKREQIIGLKLSELLDNSMLSSIQNALAGTVGHYEGEFISKFSGKATPISINFAPIVNEDRNINGGIGIFEDIADRKQIENIFFHDILNTAGNMNNLLEILDDESLSDEERKDLMKVLDEIAKRIIDEIQTHKHLVSTEKSKIILNIKKVSSMTLIKKMYDNFNHQEILKNNKLILTADSINTEFETDEILLVRVLSNMIKNAIEASLQADRIILSCGKDQSQVIFSVHNNAVIPEEVKNQIFAHLVSTKGTGRGLGLYSMKLLTEKYLNGEISFHSTKEEGTTFTVKYPINYLNK